MACRLGSLLGFILFLSRMMSCCEISGTNLSKGLEACVKSLDNCGDVDGDDLRSCFESCLAKGKCGKIPLPWLYN